MKFCVQLYSLRDIAQQKGAEGALAAVAAAGYDGVEFAGFYGMTAAALRELLDRYSLVALSAHTVPRRSNAPWISSSLSASATCSCRGRAPTSSPRRSDTPRSSTR